MHAGAFISNSKSGLLYGILQHLAGGELHNLGGGNYDFFAGTGVAALASSALSNLEAAEAGEYNGIATLKGFYDGSDGCIKSSFCLSLGCEVRLGKNLFYKFCFGHSLISVTLT